jgi:predicted transcriptional regulator
MLSAALTSSRKTRIMYQANLNCVQVEKYLKTLLDEELLQHDNGSYYLITEKGKEFLRVYGDYADRCKRLVEVVDGTVKHRLILEGMCFSLDSDVTLNKILKEVLF